MSWTHWSAQRLNWPRLKVIASDFFGHNFQCLVNSISLGELGQASLENTFYTMCVELALGCRHMQESLRH